MICSIIAFRWVLRTANNLLILLEIYMHSISVKQHVLEVLVGLGVVHSYQTINSQNTELAKLGEVIESPTLLQVL